MLNWGFNLNMQDILFKTSTKNFHTYVSLNLNITFLFSLYKIWMYKSLEYFWVTLYCLLIPDLHYFVVENKRQHTFLYFVLKKGSYVLCLPTLLCKNMYIEWGRVIFFLRINSKKSHKSRNIIIYFLIKNTVLYFSTPFICSQLFIISCFYF